MSQITKVYLLNAPLENDYKNTLYFADKSVQQSYFQSRIVKSFTDFSYQRKDSVIRVPAHFDTLQNVNYVMYQNSQYSSKWFYAFITDIKYINDERTDVYIETDCMQTWMFDIDVKASFVEREHVSDDTPGLHTVPEGLELGGYTIDKVVDKNTLKYRGFLVGATIDLEAEDLKSTDINVAGGLYNGVYSGIKYFYYATPDQINAKLTAVAEAGKSDSIHSIFCVPTTLISTTGNVVDNSTTVTEQDWAYAILGGSSDTVQTRPTTITGYTPSNKKLLTYPYMYLMVTNNSGASAIYHYEKFSTDTIDFKIYSALTPGMSIRLVPKNYNRAELAHSEGLNLGKFPICSWNSDVYTNWLTQNGVNIALSLGSSAVSIGSGIAMMAAAPATAGLGALAGGSSIGNGLMGIANTVGEVYQHSLTPPQAEGNINSGDVTFANGTLTFSLYFMTIKQEYARIIDDFFNMFGYKVNRVKVPNKAHRARYWYTKTIDANIDGAIPTQDMQVIKNCYDNGITFWRNLSGIGDYSASNEIV